MSGTINSLGLGSGVLTSDLLDRLKAADTANIITPIDKKITLNNQKGQALDLLSSLLTTFKSSVAALDDDGLYQKRTVSGSNDGVSVTALAGTQVQDFSLNITNIAKKNVLESAAYTSSTALIANGNGTMNLGIGSKNYSINYTSSTTLSDLKQSITDAAGSDVTASVLQTGTSAYKLIVTSKNTGLAQTISLSDTTKDATTGASVASQLKDANLITPSARTGTFASDSTAIATGSGTLNVNIGATTVPLAYTATTTLSDLVSTINADSTLNAKVTANIVQFGTGDYRMVLTPKSGISNSITMTDAGTNLKAGITSTAAESGAMGIIQDAQDAKFTYDGISMSRSTNTITDISYGTTINLLKDSGSANISITQDRAQIATEMEGMVNNYNTLIKQIGDMTAYDATAGKVGIFNGDNTIKNISREITKMITSYNTSGYSLPQYGISLDKTGVMSFDKATFTAKLDADPTGTETFFSGKTAITSVGTTKTGSLSASNALISSGASGIMTIQIAGVGHDFNYTNTTTLEQMRDTINADTAIASKLTASIVQSGTADYRMVLTPKGNSIGETISIGDSTTGGLIAALKTTSTTADVTTSTDGVFTSLNNLFKNYMSSTGLMTNLTNSSNAATTTLNTERTKANALLTARYDTLQAKFAAYDSLISKLNSSFSSLKQQIDAQAKSSG
jgi:flagellar hook-associated protein 2